MAASSTISSTAFRLSVDPDLIEDMAVPIDCAPQPVLLAADSDDDLVEVPDVGGGSAPGKRKDNQTA